MKNILFSLSLLFCSSIYAQETPPQKGVCFLVQGNKPEAPKPCVINTGGGAGGSYVQFKVGKTNVLIEESEGDVSVGNSPKTLKDGVNYMRDHKTLKVIPNSEEDFPKFFCTKQKSGSLDACFK